MSFSVSVKGTEIEYSGSGFKGIFSNKKNLLNIRFLKMIYEIIFFYKKVSNDITKVNEKITLGEYY